MGNVARSVGGQTTVDIASLIPIASWSLDPKQFGLRAMSKQNDKTRPCIFTLVSRTLLAITTTLQFSDKFSDGVIYNHFFKQK
jgi:hypothetical protein